MTWRGERRLELPYVTNPGTKNRFRRGANTDMYTRDLLRPYRDALFDRNEGRLPYVDHDSVSRALLKSLHYLRTLCKYTRRVGRIFLLMRLRR